jgi:hypothetical protein
MATVLEPKLDRGAAPEGSDRSFGFLFVAVFALIACWPLWHGAVLRWWAAGLAVAFALAALAAPEILRPLHRCWLGLGRLIQMVVSPLVMGAIYFLCVTPIGLIMRLCGKKDVLSLSRRPDLESFWIVRDTAMSETQSMKNQF